MCRNLVLAATVVSLALAAPTLATPALAEATAPGKPAAVQPPPAKSAPVRPEAAPAKATAAERRLVEREEPMARAAFWGREVRLDPTDAEAGLKFAAALRALGQYQPAAEAAEQVTIQHPDNAEAYLALARAKLAQKDGFFAITPARRAMTLLPRDWRPLNLLAYAYEQTGQDAQAIEAYNLALALSPKNPDVLTNLALLYGRTNNQVQAEQLLRLALAQPGAGAQTRQNLAQLLGKQGRLDEARTLMIQDLPPEVVENNLRLLKGGA